MGADSVKYDAMFISFIECTSNSFRYTLNVWAVAGITFNVTFLFFYLCIHSFIYLSINQSKFIQDYNTPKVILMSGSVQK